MTEIVLNQNYPGGVMRQLADACDTPPVYDQYVPGGPVWQLYGASGLADPFDQYAPGGPIGQIEAALEVEPAGPANLVVGNGTFDDATGWTLDAGATISGGQLNLPLANSQAQCTAVSTIVEGTYAYSFDLIDAPNGDVVTLLLGGNTKDVASPSTPLGSVTGTMTSPGSNQTIAMFNNDGTSAIIDNLTITLVP